MSSVAPVRISLPPPVIRVLAAAYRRSPLLGGHLRLAPPWVRRRLDGIDGDVMATLRNGVRIRVDPRDYNGRELLLFGAPDRRIVNLCRSLIRAGDCFLDLGANHGAVGLLCADLVGRDGAVHLVEPQPGLGERIAECLASNPSLPVHLHRIGLWDSDGTLTMARPTGHSGAATFVTGVVDDATSDHLSVPVRDVSAWVREVVGERTFGAKVDVEGAETIIVPALMKMPNCRFVAFECKHGETGRTIWDAAAAAGRPLRGLERTAVRLRTTPIERLDDFGRQTDYVALAPGGPTK
ncbi:MAG: FkbM family methyltransferase [Phycisphaerales bacterium]|nr:FkbM family methyltransferase [Phycisphaerales bacterium]